MPGTCPTNARSWYYVLRNQQRIRAPPKRHESLRRRKAWAALSSARSDDAAFRFSSSYKSLRFEGRRAASDAAAWPVTGPAKAPAKQANASALATRRSADCRGRSITLKLMFVSWRLARTCAALGMRLNDRMHECRGHDRAAAFMPRLAWFRTERSG